jgi:hypothetical protein
MLGAVGRCLSVEWYSMPSENIVSSIVMYLM